MPNHPLFLTQRVADPRIPARQQMLTACQPFWVTTPPSGGFTFEYCILQRDAVMAAINKVLASGVEEYHVGSRGLKRLSLKDLRDWLQFWLNAANDAALGFSSAIQTRRAVPCDV
jgi:hypothetical protein